MAGRRIMKKRWIVTLVAMSFAAVAFAGSQGGRGAGRTQDEGCERARRDVRDQAPAQIRYFSDCSCSEQKTSRGTVYHCSITGYYDD